VNADRQAASADLQETLNQLVADGPDLGLQVAAYLDGELIVDAWAGVTDPTSRVPVDGETIFWASSCGKGIAATCVHMLAERDQLDYEAPVASYWPAFGVQGKDQITVRQVLSHKAGVPTPPDPFDVSMLVDWDRMAAGIAGLAPQYPPGTVTTYHNYTFGFIVGEIIRHIDGRPIAEFVQAEICRPLGIEGVYFGVPDAELGRVATRVPDNDFNRREFRQACIPSSGLYTTARGLARHYAMLAEGGTLDGVTLLSPARIRAAAEIQTDELDAIWNVRVKRGLGYRLAEDTGPGAGPGALGHVGAAMCGYADPARRFAFAFVKNVIDSAAGWGTAESVYARIERSLPAHAVSRHHG
jgi:CubicO group peptidase (beta-lactamase class C family)